MNAPSTDLADLTISAGLRRKTRSCETVNSGLERRSRQWRNCRISEGSFSSGKLEGSLAGLKDLARVAIVNTHPRSRLHRLALQTGGGAVLPFEGQQIVISARMLVQERAHLKQKFFGRLDSGKNVTNRTPIVCQ